MQENTHQPSYAEEPIDNVLTSSPGCPKDKKIRLVRAGCRVHGEVGDVE
jgi:hypothetical protein